MMDRGTGAPIVLIPGIQGRWEWMAPAVETLASRCRVVTDSLPGDRGSLRPADESRGFDTFVDWLDAVLERTGLDRTALCGVSYGGLIALRYAAARPHRVTRLVLASTPAPGWTPGCRVERYLRAPRLMSPVFALSSPLRLYPEIASALPELGRRARFSLTHLLRVTRHPFAPTLMAQRVRLLATADLLTDCERVTAPTLVVTGSPGLDRVVPVSSTREYVTRIAGATHVEIAGTGHIGLVTRPQRFAAPVVEFVTGRDAAARRLQVSA